MLSARSPDPKSERPNLIKLVIIGTGEAGRQTLNFIDSMQYGGGES